jgi:hypothetical protein
MIQRNFLFTESVGESSLATAAATTVAILKQICTYEQIQWQIYTTTAAEEEKLASFDIYSEWSNCKVKYD